MSSVEILAAKAPETTTFKVVIARLSNSEVLLVHDGHNLMLPKVAIPKWTRVTPEIAESVLRLSGLTTISLFHPEVQNTAGEPGDQYAILEPRDSSWQPPTGFHWVSRDGLRNSFNSMEAAQSLEDALATADAYNSGTLHGPFARAGWFDELVSWAQEQLDPYGLNITGEFRQLNCGPTFSLVRLETTGPAVWFKAVGEPNLREFPITTALAKHFPDYLPTLVGTQPSCNGWLTFEVQGTMLDENSDLSAWEKAAETLAELQIQSVGQTRLLLDAPSWKIKIGSLLGWIDPFLDVMAELMAKQPKIPPPILSRHDLDELGTQLKDTCCSLGELDLPEGLGHLDFNPGNIMIASEQCVFLDWAEAYVGHPFFTFEYLREHLARMHPTETGWGAKVTSRYLKPWKYLVSADKLSRALEITPLVAIFAYAAGTGAWQDAQRLENPQLAGYLRALTRRMQRETQRARIGGGDA